MNDKPTVTGAITAALLTGLAMVLFLSVFDFIWTLARFGTNNAEYHGFLLELLFVYGLVVLPAVLAGLVVAAICLQISGLRWIFRHLPFGGVPAAVLGSFLFFYFLFFTFRMWLPEDFRIASARGVGLTMGIVMGTALLGVLLAWAGSLIVRRNPVRVRLGFFAFTGVVLVAAIGMALLGPPDPPRAAPAGTDPALPNIVLILVDTLRADYVSAYNSNHVQTPHIDSLAGDGIVFENALTPTPWTRPAIASLWTALHPPSHQVRRGRRMGVQGRPDRLSQKAVTLAELLKEQGYGTYGFNTNIMIGPEFQLNQGFDIYKTFRPALFGKSLLCDFLGAVFHGQYTDLSYEDGGDLTDYVIQWLRNEEPQSPYFLYVHYMDPHEPYWNNPGAMWSDHTKHWDRTHTEFSIANYKKEVQYVDRQVGRLLDHLRKSGVYDDALVIFVSDHGEEFFEHGRSGHGDNLVTEQLAVPYIVKLPGSQRAGERVSTLVSLTDTLPTVLEVAGVAVPEDVQGANILGNLLPDRHLFCETGTEIEGMQGITTPLWRYLERLGHQDPDSTVPDIALYNQREDPFNTTSVLDQYAEVAAILKQLIKDYKSDALDRALPEEMTELSEEAKEQMRKLGYTGG